MQKHSLQRHYSVIHCSSNVCVLPRARMYVGMCVGMCMGGMGYATIPEGRLTYSSILLLQQSDARLTSRIVMLLQYNCYNSYSITTCSIIPTRSHGQAHIHTGAHTHSTTHVHTMRIHTHTNIVVLVRIQVYANISYQNNLYVIAIVTHVYNRIFMQLSTFRISIVRVQWLCDFRLYSVLLFFVSTLDCTGTNNL